MKRSVFKRVWLSVAALMFMSAFFVYQKGEDYQTQISRAISKREQLDRELRASNRLSSTLMQLDKITFDEQDATRLNILRHLGLEQSRMDIRLGSKVEEKIGRVAISGRQVDLSGTATYGRILEQLDVLHSGRKMVIESVQLKVPKEGRGDELDFDVKGKIYGLDKSGK